MKAIVIRDELALLSRDGVFLGYVYPDGEIIHAAALEIVFPVGSDPGIFEITADEIFRAMGAE